MCKVFSAMLKAPRPLQSIARSAARCKRVLPAGEIEQVLVLVLVLECRCCCGGGGGAAAAPAARAGTLTTARRGLLLAGVRIFSQEVPVYDSLMRPWL